MLAADRYLSKKNSKPAFYAFDEVEQSASDAGLFFAIRWLKRKHGESPVAIKNNPNKPWLVDDIGQELVYVELHSNHQLWVATTETTAGQVSQIEGMEFSNKNWKQRNPSPVRPAVNLNSLDAFQFCNRLSKKCGIPPEHWCYEQISGQWKLRSGYEQLDGYRLMTDAEWKFLQNAGAHTKFAHGEFDNFLDNYSWVHTFSADGNAQQVAQKMPNRFGLFDMIGNAWEWSHPNGILTVGETVTVRLGGSGWLGSGAAFNSSEKTKCFANQNSSEIGLRVVRRAAKRSQRR